MYRDIQNYVTTDTGDVKCVPRTVLICLIQISFHFFVHFIATTIERKHYTSSIDLMIVMKTRFHIVPVSLCLYLENRLL